MAPLLQQVAHARGQSHEQDLGFAENGGAGHERIITAGFWLGSRLTLWSAPVVLYTGFGLWLHRFERALS